MAHRGAEDVIQAARSGLRSEPRINLHRTPIHLSFADGVMTVEGEVKNVAAKKLALEHVAALPEVIGILDRLRVQPAQRMGDGEIRDLVRDALLQEPTLSNLTIEVIDKGKASTVRGVPTGAAGTITASVHDGVVTLDGEVPGLAQKRLSGVLAWWVPGSRDVINGLGIEPPEQDNDMEITEAVRVTLEKDPLVDASQMSVSTRDGTVTLRGLVPTTEEREAAEFDAWFVFGVDSVLNCIQVHR